MIKISEELKRASIEHNIYIEILKESQVQRISKDIHEKYIKNTKSNFLWENLRDFSAFSSVNGWAFIRSFIKESRCVMFFNEFDDRNMVLINNGNDLHTILSETYGFEFYITNLETEYVICYNHHDCLLGCGNAKVWIDSLR